MIKKAMKFRVYVNIIFVVLLLLVTYYLWSQSVSTKMENYKNEMYLKSEKSILIAESILNNMVNRFNNEIELMSDLIEFEIEYLSVYSGDEFSRIANSMEFRYLYSNDYAYMIRTLDAKGKESTRLDKNGPIITTVPTSKLQDKSDRYYFIDTMKSDKNNTYYSPIDLNIENGKIEIPLRPTIRVAKKMYYKDELAGILVINYDIIKVLNQIKSFLKSEDLDLQIMNESGFWISNQDKSLEWGFMYNNKKNTNLKVQNSDLWNWIISNETGNYDFDDYWISYKKVKLTDNNELLLLSQTPKRKFKEEHSETLLLYGMFYSVLCVLTILVSYFAQKSYINRLRVNEKLELQAMTDSLTGISNRLCFNRDLRTKVSQDDDLMFAVFFMDLDGFKSVNDRFGHEIGDNVLIDVTRRLKRVLREQDKVYRLGGDEFTLIIDIKQKEDVEIVSRKIIDAISHRYVYGDVECIIGVSIGISIYPLDSDSDNGLINLADDNMYEVKKSGKNNYFYNK